MKLKVGLERTREVPVAWQNALWTIAPPSEKHSWLFLRWEPGDSWEPIERWFIWQMRPKRLIRPDILAELQGPSPRSEGHYCADGFCLCRHKKQGWRGGAAMLIDRAQWELYRETGCYGTRWWCIQGPFGGHKHRLNPTESRVSQMFGGKADTPGPGDLPYAPFDNRVFQKVAPLDKIRAWTKVIEFCDRNHDMMDEEERDANVEAQKLLWSHLESQSGKALEGITNREWSEFREAAPRILGQRNTTDFEAIQKEFVENPNT